MPGGHGSLSCSSSSLSTESRSGPARGDVHVQLRTAGKWLTPHRRLPLEEKVEIPELRALDRCRESVRELDERCQLVSEERARDVPDVLGLGGMRAARYLRKERWAARGVSDLVHHSPASGRGHLAQEVVGLLGCRQYRQRLVGEPARRVRNVIPDRERGALAVVIVTRGARGEGDVANVGSGEVGRGPDAPRREARPVNG